MLAFIFAGLIVVLDQFFKRWISNSLVTPEGVEPMVVVPGALTLTFLENHGAMLGILAGQRWLLAGIALVAAIVLIAIILRYDEGFWGTLGLASVLGGTVGNLFDRIFNNGAVIDMFQIFPDAVSFPIFNIADIFITLGFVTFLIHFISISFKEKGREELAGDYYDDEYDDEYNDQQYHDGYDNSEYDGEYGGGYNDNDGYNDSYGNQGYDSGYNDGYSEFPEMDSVANTQYSEDGYGQYEDTGYYAPDSGVALPGEYDSTTDTTPDHSYSPLYDELETEVGSLDEYNIDDISIDDLLREYGVDSDDN